MNFQTRLAEILHAVNMIDQRTMEFLPEEEAQQQITELFLEIIGEDETFVKPTTKRRTYSEISRYSRQALKNELRKAINDWL